MDTRNLLYDQLPHDLAQLPRVCPRSGCPSPNDVELKYFNNKSNAGFTQPRFFCNGCHNFFTLGGKLRETRSSKSISKHKVGRKLRGSNEPISTKSILKDEIKTSKTPHELIKRNTTDKLKIIETLKEILYNDNIVPMTNGSHYDVIYSPKVEQSRKEMKLLEDKIKSYLLKVQISFLDIDTNRSVKCLEKLCENIKIHVVQNLSHEASELKDIKVENEIIENFLIQLERLDYEAFTINEIIRIVEIGKHFSKLLKN
ncbi:hypothetical protein KC19_8G117700 [Ceratodon purpureus]|uniref:Dof-type domain-containing protein n=1 Tax=Ceratodon purpureus TaxID=3225 RepID=A0A8T0GXW3_CERPU|nr:hypothetical protein KC19_8G117700 [Ceratodon purpureus]